MPTDQPRRGRGRPRQPILSGQAITDAALKIAADRGHHQLTVASLARELGVSASALYNHVRSKDELMLWVQDRLNEEIDASVFDRLPWHEALIAWARSYRTCFARNTAMIPIMAVLPIADAPRTLDMYERVIRGLTDAGIDPQDALEIIVAVEAYAFGAAYDATAPANIFEPGDPERAPTFAAAAAARAKEPSEAADRAFERGLSAMVRGFRADVDSVDASGATRRAGPGPAC